MEGQQSGSLQAVAIAGILFLNWELGTGSWEPGTGPKDPGSSMRRTRWWSLARLVAMRLNATSYKPQPADE